MSSVTVVIDDLYVNTQVIGGIVDSVWLASVFSLLTVTVIATTVIVYQMEGDDD